MICDEFMVFELQILLLGGFYLLMRCDFSKQIINLPICIGFLFHLFLRLFCYAAHVGLSLLGPEIIGMYHIHGPSGLFSQTLSLGCPMDKLCLLGITQDLAQPLRIPTVR